MFISLHTADHQA